MSIALSLRAGGAVLGIVVLLGACGSMRAFRSVPADRLDEARVLGGEQVRTWGDEVAEWFRESLAEAVRQERAWYAAHPGLAPAPTVDLLAISGGGGDGAYGAGLLCGWTARGDRPSFKLVTGVSTGALIAPFAFLGPVYDDILREAYTTIVMEDVATTRSLLSLIYSDGIYDTEPLAALIERWVTLELLEAIAAEHAKGRRLLICTVNLEAQRPVIWDMGAIATSRHPSAPALFRQVMLASASIPGAFEPQYFAVELDGEIYEEMHVDGGTIAQVFLWGGGVSIPDITARAGLQRPTRPIRVFVIRNGRLHPQHEKVPGQFVEIAGRAVQTLLKSQSIGDLVRLYVVAEKNGMRFRISSIPRTFTPTPESMFDPDYMGALFDFAHDRALSGTAWTEWPVE